MALRLAKLKKEEGKMWMHDKKPETINQADALRLQDKQKETNTKRKDA